MLRRAVRIQCLCGVSTRCPGVGMWPGDTWLNGDSRGCVAVPSPTHTRGEAGSAGILRCIPHCLNAHIRGEGRVGRTAADQL